MFANLLNNTSLSVGSPPLTSLSGGGRLKNLLGSGLGKLASGGTIGAVTSLISGLTSLFKGSPPTAFAEKGKVFIGSIVPQIKNQYQNDIGQMLTEMSKAYNYMILLYTAHLNGSTSERSKTGNQMGMDYVQSFQTTFNQFVSQLKQTHDISSTEISYTFPKQFLNGIKSFSGSHSGSYTQYTATEKKGSLFGKSSNSTNTNSTLTKGSSTFAGVGFMAIILGGMFLPQIKKLLKS